MEPSSILWERRLLCCLNCLETFQSVQTCLNTELTCLALSCSAVFMCMSTSLPQPVAQFLCDVAWPLPLESRREHSVAFCEKNTGICALLSLYHALEMLWAPQGHLEALEGSNSVTFHLRLQLALGLWIRRAVQGTLRLRGNIIGEIQLLPGLALHFYFSPKELVCFMFWCTSLFSAVKELQKFLLPLSILQFISTYTGFIPWCVKCGASLTILMVF